MGKHRRVNRDAVRQNAEKGSGGNSWFALPEGVRDWSPKKAERMLLDILPYEVKTESHPDDIAQGELWYKLPFSVHHGLGGSSTSLVCPKSINKRCPVCEERDRLTKEDPEKNEDAIKQLKPQRFVAYNIKDPEDAEKIAVFVYSYGKFASCLQDELKDPENDEHLAFFDVTEDGRTLKVRFSEEEFMGKKFIAATKIDFRPREEMDEEEILGKVVCLEEALQVPTYEKLKALFFQESEEEAPKEDDEEEAPKAGKKPAREEDEEEEAEEDEEEEAPKPKKSTKPVEEDEDEDDEEEAPKPSKKPAKKDDDEEEVEEDDEEDAPKPGKKPVPDTEDDDEDGEAEEEDEPVGKKCKACQGSGKNSKGGKCLPCAGTGKLKAPNARVEEDEEEEAPKPKKPAQKEPAEDDEEEAPSKPKTGGKKCPAGGTFGKDVDKHDECDDCPLWEACEEASGK